MPIKKFEEIRIEREDENEHYGKLELAYEPRQDKDIEIIVDGYRFHHVKTIGRTVYVSDITCKICNRLGKYANVTYYTN